MPNPGPVHGAAHTWRPSTERPPETIACTNLHRGPHNRCEHPTPPPAGYHRCEGEHGCPILIANRHRERLCHSHTDDWTPDKGPYRDLLELP